MPKDPKLSEEQEAAKQGDANAQYNLGVMYARGRGVEQDHATAAEWYQKAAAQGYASAQYNLGVMYETGYGVPQDDAMAVEWYREAALQDHVDAQYRLGRMYENGGGVEEEEEEEEDGNDPLLVDLMEKEKDLLFTLGKTSYLQEVRKVQEQCTSTLCSTAPHSYEGNSTSTASSDDGDGMASAIISKKISDYFDSMILLAISAKRNASAGLIKKNKAQQAVPVNNERVKIKQKTIRDNFDGRQENRRDRLRALSQNKETANITIRKITSKKYPPRKGPLLAKTPVIEWLWQIKRDFHGPDSEFYAILALMTSKISQANASHQHTNLILLKTGILHTGNYSFRGITVLPDSRQTELLNIPPCFMITSGAKEQSNKKVDEELLARGRKTHERLKKSNPEMRQKMAKYSESIICLMILSLALPQMNLTNKLSSHPNDFLYPILFYESCIRKPPKEIMQAFEGKKECASYSLITKKARSFIEQLTEAEKAIKNGHTEYRERLSLSY